MRKLHFTTLFLFFFYVGSFFSVKGQTTNSIEDLNKITPQSPSVSSLMKFEEVPISQYTGIPDVNIPIGNFPTISAKLKLNLSINYHPLNAKVDDIASEYGLGWSLFAGGMISRTIRDLPDESSHTDGEKYGMFYTANSANTNKYNQVKDYILNGVNPANENNVFRHVFESALFNRFDNSYDLYQYNFMGYTGRFFIKKKENNGLLELVKLDKNNLKIDFTFDSNNKPLKFEIIDENGIKYVFDIVGTSSRNYLIDASHGSSPNNTNMSVAYSGLNTEFYLNEVYENNILLLKFNYENPTSIVQSNTLSKRRGDLTPNGPDILQSDCYDDIISTLPADYETSVTSNNVFQRFIDYIDVINKAKIYFNYLTDREDTNLASPNNNKKLEKIIIKDDYDHINKQFKFDYVYTQSIPDQNIHSKMFLDEVSILDKDLQDEMSYKFSYGGNGLPFQYDEIGKDLWGHYRCVQSGSVLEKFDPSLKYEPSPTCVQKDVLTKLILPTGGEIHYNYELNKYNYEPTTMVGPDPSINPIHEITNFDSNLQNWDVISTSVTINNFGGSPQYFFTVTESQEIWFQSIGVFETIPWALNFFKLNEATGLYENAYSDIHSLGTPIDPNPNHPNWEQRLNVPPGKYAVTLGTVPGGSIPTNFTTVFKAYFRKKNLRDNFLYGGGIRINNIEYYNKPGEVQKKKLYEYNDINTPSKSSGALVFPKPMYQYEEGYNNFFLCIDGSSGNIISTHSLDKSYFTTADKNLFSPEKTRGADVGYKYITVKDIDYTVNNANPFVSKGKTVYTYSSPIDYPNPLFSYFSLSPPAAYTSNFDYKRGDVLNKKIFNDNNELVFEEKNEYSDNYTTEISGLNLITKKDFIYNKFHVLAIDNYSFYKTRVNNCVSNPTGPFCTYTNAMGFGTNPFNFVFYYFSKEIIGKTNLIKSEQTEYFPNGNSLITINNYEYNSRDYLTKKKTTLADNNITESLYQYAHEKGNQLMIDKNMIGIPLETTTTKTKGSTTKTLSKTETVYPSSVPTAQTGNLVLPISVKSYDIQNNIPSTELTYDKYDEKGNLLQYTTKDGIPTAIIWGYNNTQPIAKIEDVTYSSASSFQEFDNIITKSNEDVDTATQNTLIEALDSFRRANNRFQITTYTYDPLIGVTSITPPSGLREIYVYDSFNRLKEVKQQEKDSSGNLVYKTVKEYSYNYKN